MENKNDWTPEVKTNISASVSEVPAKSTKAVKTDSRKLLPIIAGVTTGLIVFGGGAFYLFKYSPLADELTGVGDTNDVNDTDEDQDPEDSDDTGDDTTSTGKWTLYYDNGFDLSLEYPEELMLSATQDGFGIYDDSVEENSYVITYSWSLTDMSGESYLDQLTKNTSYEGELAIDGRDYTVEEYTWTDETNGNTTTYRLVTVSDNLYIEISFNDAEISDQELADAYSIVMSTDLDAMKGWRDAGAPLFGLRYPSTWELSKNEVEEVGGELIADLQIQSPDEQYKLNYYLAPGGGFPVCKYTGIPDSAYADLSEETSIIDLGDDYVSFFNMATSGYERSTAKFEDKYIVCRDQYPTELPSTWLPGEITIEAPDSPDEDMMHTLDLIVLSFGFE